MFKYFNYHIINDLKKLIYFLIKQINLFNLSILNGSIWNNISYNLLRDLLNWMNYKVGLI